jgi:CRP-like cAMP-binding protein
MTATVRPRPIEEVPNMAALAVQLLSNPNLALPFRTEDARALLPYLRLLEAPAGCVLVNEGDSEHAGNMFLVLEGEVQVGMRDGGDAVTFAIVGPGELLGELGLLDGRPRSAHCAAITPVRAAGLSRASLQRMHTDAPDLTARFMAVIAHRIAERLRSLGDQLRMYAQRVEEQRLRLEAVRR